MPNITYIDHEGTASLVVQASSASGSGNAAVYQSAGTMLLERTLLANNAYGAYIASGATSTTFDRCTVSYNTGTSYAAIETYVPSGTTTIVSSIISHNASVGVRRSNAGTLNVTYSNLWGNSGSFGPPPTHAMLWLHPGKYQTRRRGLPPLSCKYAQSRGRRPRSQRLTRLPYLL